MRLTSIVVTAAVLVGAAALPGPAQAAATQTRSQPSSPGQLIAEQAVTGSQALAAITGRLPELAERNGMSEQTLTRVLSTDATAWLDPSGRLFYIDPPQSASGATTAAGPFPTSQTFTLHSRPGSNRTIYLDFDGEVVSGTSWNGAYGISTARQPAFDLDGSPGSWSQAEHDAIQSIFLRVAEDYAIFDVDVTTQAPDPARLERSSLTDTVFGTRALITPSSEAAGKICGSSCGGVAYIGVFNEVFNVDYQPAWVFPQLLSMDTKNIAEAVSHEVGHNFGLDHDGTPGLAYYQGHAMWAPIMGVGYYNPVTQWSRGEYTGATNTEDDLTVIANHGVTLRADDHGNTRPTASTLSTSATGVIESRTDLDMFAVDRTCTGSATVTAAPAAVSPNLDIGMRLLDSAGTVLATDNPIAAKVTTDTASGLGASITRSLPAGRYYVEVDGVGALSPTTGYSDYGSVGQFSLTVTGCGGGGAPSVTARTPAPGATAVSRSVNVKVGFSETVTGVTTSSFQLRRTGTATPVAATVRWSAAAQRWVLNPSATLAARTSYTVTVTGGSTAVRDLDGTPLTTTTWTFTTGG